MFNFFKSKPKPKALEVTSKNFNEFIYNAPEPTLLDFYADWCQPCQVMGSLISRLVKDEEIPQNAKIAKINIDANPELAQIFNIRSVPTLLFVYDNKVYERQNGLIPYVQLKEKFTDFCKEHSTDKNE